MESAIPKDLKCPRTQARRSDGAYVPPYPAWTGRADNSVERVVMGYFGIQFEAGSLRVTAQSALREIVASFSLDDGPGHHDLAENVDGSGFTTLVAIAYWTDFESFERWRGREEVDGWWSAPERFDRGLGFFREILSPRISAFETIFSAADRLEGVSVATGLRSSEDIQEHAYWGSMRDRLPLAQTDDLAAIDAPYAAEDSAPKLGERVRIVGHKNMAVIRSGQDWGDTTDQERRLYLEDMEPVLRAGMDFLRDEGRAIGCYVNRYMVHLDGAGLHLEKSFGLSYWHSLAEMERWSESHPTHVRIFGTFMRIVQELDFNLKLRLYHEVSVLRPEEQEYEYINCHPNTGLLRAT